MDVNRVKRYYSILLTAAMIILMFACAAVYAEDTVSGEEAASEADKQTSAGVQQYDETAAADTVNDISADPVNCATAGIQQSGAAESDCDESTSVSAEPDTDADGDISGEAPAGYNMWVSEGEDWFYLDDSGEPVRLGWKKLRPYGDESKDVRWCWFNKAGVFKKDISKNTAKKWIKAGGRKYWFTGKKKPAGKGFLLVGKKVYYFDSKGAMVKGRFKVGSKKYKTRKDGSLGGLIYYRIRYKTFVLIDISEQKLRYYKNGKLKLKANVVTGLKGVHDTPTGITHVMSKARNVNLSGATWNVNVSYWMLFRSGGYGMHDAPWRSSSQINSRSTYLKNGSHGCVNMKRSDAASLYSKVSKGTTVIVCK